MQLKEEALFTLKFDGKPVINELGELEKKLNEVKDAQKEVERGTKEWADNKVQIKELEASIKLVREEMGVAGMTVRQLEGYQRQLNREIKDSTLGTDEYKKKAADLTEVNTAIANHRQNIRGVADEAKNTQSIWTNVKTWIASAFSIAVLLEAGRAILGFFSDSVKEFRAFQSAAQDLSANTAIVGKSLDYLKEQAKEVGPAMGKSAAEMLEAYKLVGGANSELTKVPKTLAEVTKNALLLSQAAKMDLESATRSLVGTMNQFNASAGESGRYMNVMAAGAQVGSAEIDELASSLKASGTVANTANLTIEQTTAILESLSKNSIKGEQAGTGLRNVLLTLMAGAKETNPQLVGMDTALENLAKKQLTAAEMAKLFGKENVTTAMLMVQNRGQIQEFTKAVTGTSAGFEMAKTQAASYDHQVKVMDATIKTLTVSLGEAFIPTLTKGVQGVVAFVNIIRAVPGFVSENRTAFAALGLAVLAFNGHLVVATASSIYHAAQEKARLVWTNSATAAQWLLNTAMTANPIGAVVAAVALLVAGFVTVYNRSQTLRAGIAGLWQAMQTAAQVALQFVKAVLAMDVKGMADAMLNGGKKVGEAFTKGYGDKLNEERPKQLAAHKALIDTKVKAEKDSAVVIGNHQTDEEKKTLAKKATEAAKHRADEVAKAKKAAEQEAQEAIKANNDGLKTIEHLRIESIKDELDREKAKIRAKRDAEVEAMMASKASAEVKAVWETALNAQMIRDITKAETDYRSKKAQEEEKDRKERDQRERETSNAVAEAAYNSHHQSLERQLADTSLKASTRKQIEMELINTERTETLRKINDQYNAEVQKLAKEKAEAIRTAQEKGQSIDTLENQFRQQYTAAELQRRTSETKAESTFQDNKRDLEKKSLEARKANQQAWFDAIKGLMTGDFTTFTDLLSKKLSGEKKQLSDAQKANIEKIDTIGGYAVMGVQALSALSTAALNKELGNINKEKTTQLAAWKDKYDKGLINKDQYEKGVDKINKDADVKTKETQLAAFKRQQKLDIIMAVINGIQAALKSLAMFGWPFGLIGAAGAAVAAGIQIAAIKSQQPPSMKRGGVVNAGVPEGPRHGSNYGDSGLSITRRDTGEEVAEMEGGEPVMVLSRNTYANNKRVVDSLMHSSLHRNGAPVMANGGILFEDGGYTQADQSSSVYNGSSGAGTSEQSGGSSSEASGDSGGSGGGGGGWMSDAGAAADDMDSSSYQAEVDKSTALMEAIGKNTLATADGIKLITQALTLVQQQIRTESDAQQSILLQQMTNLRYAVRGGLSDLGETNEGQMNTLRSMIHADLVALQTALKLELPNLGKELQEELSGLRSSVVLGLLNLRLGMSLDLSGLNQTTKTGFDSLQKGVHTDFIGLEKLLHDDLLTLQEGVHLDLSTLDLNVGANLTALEKSVHDDLNSMTRLQTVQQNLLRAETKQNFTTLQTILKTELELLQQNSHADLSALANSNSAQLRIVQGILNATKNEQGYQSTLLRVISEKNLSVSVQSIVSVWNQIDVVVDKSNFK